MNAILSQYRSLLETIDCWFTRCTDIVGAEIKCRRSCTGCCRGLFDISLLDACLLQQGFKTLSASIQREVTIKAKERLTDLRQQWPEFKPPYILNHLPHEEWQQMPEDDETPCPLLSPDGLCLTYGYRPMTCRLHGLPNVDVSGESFSDEYCSLNFSNSNPLEMKELRWEFKATFDQEFELLGTLSERLTCERQLELDTFIPTALLTDFSDYRWQQLLAAEKT